MLVMGLFLAYTFARLEVTLHVGRWLSWRTRFPTYAVRSRWAYRMTTRAQRTYDRCQARSEAMHRVTSTIGL